MKLEALRARLREIVKVEVKAEVKIEPKKRKPPIDAPFCLCGRKMNELVSQRTCEACEGYYTCDMCSASLDTIAGDKVHSTQDLEDLHGEEPHVLCADCFSTLQRNKAP